MALNRYTDRLTRLEARIQHPPCDVQHMTDAQLYKIIGLPPDCTDAELESVCKQLGAVNSNEVVG